MADNRLPCFVIGLGVGAALGLLAAPSRGSKTRGDLRRAAERGREFVTRGSADLRKCAEVAVERGRETVQEQRANLDSAYRAGMDAYRRAAGEHW